MKDLVDELVAERLSDFRRGPEQANGDTALENGVSTGNADRKRLPNGITLRQGRTPSNTGSHPNHTRSDDSARLPSYTCSERWQFSRRYERFELEGSPAERLATGTGRGSKTILAPSNSRS